MNKILIFRKFFNIKLFLMLMVLIVSSCSPKVSKIFPNIADKEFDDDLKNSSPDFVRGWKDGCEVGSAGGSNTFYKMFYRNNAIDGFKFAGNNDYRDAWNNAFWYCYRNMYIRHKSSIYSAFFGGFR